MSGKNNNSDRAVTPVVGIILLLALTVLLGATAGAYIVGLSDDATKQGAPTAAFTFRSDLQPGGPDSVTITHQTGNNIDADRLSVVVSGASCESGSDDPDGRYNVKDAFGFGAEQLSAGASVEFDEDLDDDGTRDLCTSGGSLVLSRTSFRLVWLSPTGNGRELRRWTAS